MSPVVSLRDEVEPVSEARDIPGIDEIDDVVVVADSDGDFDSDFQPLPDLRQLNSLEAVNYIKRLNAPYVVVSVYDDSPVGAVLEQSPAPGASPPEDAVITLVVSLGPRPGINNQSTSNAATDDG